MYIVAKLFWLILIMHEGHVNPFRPHTLWQVLVKFSQPVKSISAFGETTIYILYPLVRVEL